MKNFNLILSTLFICYCTTTLMAQEPAQYIDIIQDEGILFYEIDTFEVDPTTQIVDTAIGIIKYKKDWMNHDFDYLLLRAGESENRENNVVITKGGLLSIGTIDPDDDYSKLDIDTASIHYKLAVRNGEAIKEGSADWTIFSDQKLKTNIESYEKGLATLQQLNFYEYEYNGLAGTNTNQRYVGVMAQEIKEVLPNTVRSVKSKLRPESKEATSILTFNPNELLYLSMNSIKELAEKTATLEAQSQELAEVKNQYAALKEELNSIKALLGLVETQAAKKEVEMENQELASFLEQCIPNPTAGLTEISFYIKKGFQKAQIVVSNLQGQTIDSFEIRKSGVGSVCWNPQNLRAGICTYSLYIDGAVVDSKKLVLQ